MESDFGEVESGSDKARRCPFACSENKDYSIKNFFFEAFDKQNMIYKNILLLLHSFMSKEKKYYHLTLKNLTKI